MKLKIDERITERRYNDTVTDKHSCIIVDLDGTLSMMNGRSPYKGQDCGSDVLNESVAIIMDMCNQINLKVFIFSGRNSDHGGKEATIEWLKNRGIMYEKLVMRKPKDLRKDSVVKGEMFDEHIRGKYSVLVVLDDRDMMVDYWRSIGLDCFQVYYGNF